MGREHFPVRYRLDGSERFLLWYDADEELDGVAVLASGYVPSFESVDSVRKFAGAAGIEIPNDEPILHDLSAAAAWIDAPSAATVDCNTLLTAWNLFVDVARSIGREGSEFLYAQDAADTTYDRLFWGCNLPAVTPPGQRFVPNWSEDEIVEIVDVLTLGLRDFRSFVVEV